MAVIHFTKELFQKFIDKCGINTLVIEHFVYSVSLNKRFAVRYYLYKHFDIKSSFTKYVNLVLIKGHGVCANFEMNDFISLVNSGDIRISVETPDGDDVLYWVIGEIEDPDYLETVRPFIVATDRL